MPETAAISAYTNSYTQSQSAASSVDVVDFLQIMVAQLQNQDPLSPMEDQDFVTQLAQFSMLEGVNALGTSFSQSQGVALLGKQVVAVPEDSEQVISGTVTSVNLQGDDILVGVNGSYVNLSDVLWIGIEGEEQAAETVSESLSTDTASAASEAAEVTADASDTDSLSAAGLETAAQIVELAQQFLGTPYVMGAESPEDGFDCTGFTQYLYGQFGYSLTRTAESQGYNTAGTRVNSVDELQIGDLIYMNTVSGDSDLSDHAGIYIGGGQFIHASSAAGEVVISSIHSGYYKNVFSWGVRVLE